MLNKGIPPEVMRLYQGKKATGVAKKRGNGGHGPETYDRATGRYVEDGKPNSSYDNPHEKQNTAKKSENKESLMTRIKSGINMIKKDALSSNSNKIKQYISKFISPISKTGEKEDFEKAQKAADYIANVYSNPKNSICKDLMRIFTCPSIYVTDLPDDDGEAFYLSSNNSINIFYNTDHVEDTAWHEWFHYLDDDSGEITDYKDPETGATFHSLIEQEVLSQKDQIVAEFKQFKHNFNVKIAQEYVDKVFPLSKEQEQALSSYDFIKEQEEIRPIIGQLREQFKTEFGDYPNKEEDFYKLPGGEELVKRYGVFKEMYKLRSVLGERRYYLENPDNLPKDVIQSHAEDWLNARYDWGVLSDMLSCYTRNDKNYDLELGHSKRYWNDRKQGDKEYGPYEATAELGAALATGNETAINLIKKYCPKAYEQFIKACKYKIQTG